MITIKPKGCSSFIKKSLITVCGSYCSIFTKNIHDLHTKDDNVVSAKETREKRRTEKRNGKCANEEKEGSTGNNDNNTLDLAFESTQDLLTEKYSHLKKNVSPSYIFDVDVAEKIATKIIANRTNPSIPIIEYNPGPALLTKQLLKLGAPQIIGIESNKKFIPTLEKIQKKHGCEKINFYNWDPFMANWMDTRKMDSLHQNEKNSLQQIKQKEWVSSPYASIFGIINPSRSQLFLTFLQILLGSKESLYSYGRPEMFFIVPVKDYRLMIVNDPTQSLWTYGKFSTLWNLFFDVTTLLEIHKTDVFPPFKAKRHLRCESKSFGTVNKDSIYLVKIVPKKNLDPVTNCPEEYSRFVMFLRQIIKNKKHRLIPKLESWVPGCGLHLIRMGFNMLHLTGDISPKTYLEMYHKLKILPEFKESSLDAILSPHPSETESHSSKVSDQADQLPTKEL